MSRLISRPDPMPEMFGVPACSASTPVMSVMKLRVSALKPEFWNSLNSYPPSTSKLCAFSLVFR